MESHKDEAGVDHGAEPEKSPTLSAVRAGSGALIPYQPGGPARTLVAYALEGPGAGTLLCPDVLEPASREAEVALTNLNRALGLALLIQDELLVPGRIEVGPDRFLEQFLYLVEDAEIALRRLPADDAARADRVRAHELIRQLADWARRSRVLRSGAEVLPIEVPWEPIKVSVELVSIGIRLTAHSFECQRKQAADRAADHDPLVTLDQAAGICQRSKRTLEGYLQKGKIPRPDYPGGNGKANRWKWSALRPALAGLTEVRLPERFPGDRLI